MQRLRQIRKWIFLSLFWLGLFLFERSSYAGLLPDFAAQGIDTLNSVISPMSKVLGLTVDHRPYQPATPLGTAIGLDLSVEFTIVKIGEDLNTALQTIGMSPIDIPFFPVPRVHLHKGLGPMVDIGGSYIGYQSYRIIGSDLKVTVAQPEEGPTWAVRFCYTMADLEAGSTKFSSSTYTPQVLVSKLMDFVDPYLGIGYQYATGKVSLSTGLPAPYDKLESSQGSGGGFMAFLGLPIRPPNVGFKLVLEGTYSTAGAHTIGTKFGFQF